MEEKAKALYQSVIMRHYRDPTHRRILMPPAIETKMSSRSCGDKVKLYLQFETNGLIKDASYQGDGCSISMASASILCRTIVGMPLREAVELAHAVIAMLEGDDETLGFSGEPMLEEKATNDLVALNSVKDFGTRIPCATLAWKSLASVEITA